MEAEVVGEHDFKTRYDCREESWGPVERGSGGATEAGVSEGTSETVSDTFFIIITEGQRVSQGQEH